MTITTVHLFAATLVAVAVLGLQQINVERRDMLFAALTSPAIGASNWVLFKVLPGPTTLWDFAAYLVGGSIGIVLSMWLHPVLVRLLERAPVTRTGVDESEWDRLAEMQRIATELADVSASNTVRRLCPSSQFGIEHRWFDVSDHGAEEITRAVRYLDLRGRLIRHSHHKDRARIAA